MLQSAKKSMRSWMFIYIGLFAAIAVAANPVDADEVRFPEPDLRPADAETAISRTDI